MEFFAYWSWGAIFFSIIINVTASFIFILILLRLFRPRIKVVSMISKADSRFDNTETIVYGFKVINKGIFSVYDLNAEVSTFKLYQGENEITDYKYNKLTLKKDHVTNLPGYYSRKDKGGNCLQFFSYDDISKEMSDGNHIRFQLTGKHSLTGLSKVSSHSFTRESSIKNGSFVSGVCEKVEV